MHLWLLQAVLLILAVRVLSQGQATLSNPCTMTKAEQGKGFTVGIAYWPGGTIEDWGNSTSAHPCSAPDQLGDVQVAAYEVKLDTIAVMRTSRQDESRLYDSSSPKVLSVVAFAQDVRTEARYIRSGDAGITGGTGVLENLILIATFDKGDLQYLRWENNNCAGCDMDRCLQVGQVYDAEEVFACAAKGVDQCTCQQAQFPSNCTNGNQDPFACYTSFQFGATGTDKDSVVLDSGTQLQKIGSLSVTNVYSDALGAIQNAGETVSNAVGK